LTPDTLNECFCEKDAAKEIFAKNFPLKFFVRDLFFTFILFCCKDRNAHFLRIHLRTIVVALLIFVTLVVDVINIITVAIVDVVIAAVVTVAIVVDVNNIITVAIVDVVIAAVVTVAVVVDVKVVIFFSVVVVVDDIITVAVVDVVVAAVVIVVDVGVV